MLLSLLIFLTSLSLGQEGDKEQCKGTHEDCSEEVLICSTDLRSKNKDVKFDNLKLCIYEQVELEQARACCEEYVKVAREDDPDWTGEIEGLTRNPTPSPVVRTGGDPEDCPNRDTSQACLENAACEFKYWTRECTARNVSVESCFNDNRDCKDELNVCMKKERDAGRDPAIKNLEACVLMNRMAPCCTSYTDRHLSLAGLKRKNRPDRYDMTNCEHFTRNKACKNQPGCKWDKSQKLCRPMSGVVGVDTRFDPANACGFKGFKITLISEKKSQKFAGWTVRRRGVNNACDCARLCREFENWGYRSKARKCGCTNDLIQKVNIHDGWYSSTTKKSTRIKHELNKRNQEESEDGEDGGR